jgi:dihydropteroate synthase
MSFKNTHLPVANLLQSKGNLLDLSTPVVMGIINTTPDSFFEASRQQHKDGILRQAAQMISEGARILDIGGLSTRPRATIISASEETERITSAIALIHETFPDIWISIDTFRATVAEAAIKQGAHIINDISAGKFDLNMQACVAKWQVPYIAMHLKGNAHTMHEKYAYENVVDEVISDLQTTCNDCHALGIKDIIIDPGFGFSKSITDNYSLLNNMAQLRILGKPLLAGISRKSMIYKPLQIAAEEALNGTTALHMVALQQGAQILRAHDVRVAKETIDLFQML